MGFHWTLFLLYSFSLPLLRHVIALNGESTNEMQQTNTDRVTQFLTQSLYGPHGSSLAQGKPMFGPENGNFLGQPLSWTIMSSEDTDRQVVLGEYSEESTETSPSHLDERGLLSKHIKSVTADATSRQIPWSSPGHVPPNPAQEQTFRFLSAESSTVSVLQPTQSEESDPTSIPLLKEVTESHLPFLLSGLVPPHKPEQKSSPSESNGSGPNPKHYTPSAGTENWQWPKSMSYSKEEKQNALDDATDILHRGIVSTETTTDDSRKDSLAVSKTSGTFLPGANMDMFTTPCRTSDETWTPTYPDDLTPSEPLRPFLTLNPGLLVPLYSDWNSALGTWGFAWEAHTYGLGAVFSLFGLISVICLLGLPIRCPPGFPFFTLLHFFILNFAGIQAFSLVYDAYNSQDRLPPLVTQLLSELPLPCLISAFSLAFFLLSLNSRNHLSLPLAISTSFSALPKPFLLLCMCLLHFLISLGCVGLLQVFHSLPTVILLLPQGMFVCLTIFLSCSYFIFYCLRLVNMKHIYRLNDNGETGGSPEAARPQICPFSKVEDWERAAGAGLGSSLCLLGCGGLQLYGILHVLGFGGVDSYGFQPWPWWGYQIGCRFCEIGVCLGLSIIGTHPVFCKNNSSMKSITNPRPGSWSRLFCSSPSRELNVISQDGTNSPVLSSHESWSRGKQDTPVVYDVVTKRRSEVLPLCSVENLPANGVNSVDKLSQNQSTFPLFMPPKPKNMDESHQSSLESVGAETDSTGDLRPPSPINLSRSIDQALFNDSLFSHSVFGSQRLFRGSSSVSVSSLNQGTSKQGPCSVADNIYRTSSCGKVDQEKAVSSSRASQPRGTLTSRSNPVPEQLDWKGSITGSTQGLFSHPKETEKLRSNSWTNKGHNFAQSNLPRAIPHLSYHRRYRTLSLASQDSRGSGRLAGTKQLSESKQLEWDTAVQAEFVTVCRQIDALSVCSDTVEL